jgi:hypothetical protein
MTEVFGLCGIGWKYTIDRQWIEEGHGNERMAFVNVSVYIRDGDGWSDPIPGTGGNMLVAQEKNGPYNSDEAYKMATTDALSTALKMIGVAADVYAGKWDGSKYNGAEDAAEDLRDTLREYILSGKLTDIAVDTVKHALDAGESDVAKLKAYVARCKSIVEGK